MTQNKILVQFHN